jgi:DNA-binding Lrp family transcriptional regulator
MTMTLSRKQFDLLEALAMSKKPMTQRDLEKRTGHSLGTINRVMKELTEAGYAGDGIITNAGLEALEPYRAKRAVFIAAGFGTRLSPLAEDAPGASARRAVRKAFR